MFVCTPNNTQTCCPQNANHHQTTTANNNTTTTNATTNRTLLEKYRADGFELAAVPCNQFGGQSPGTDEEERAAAYFKFGRDDFDVFDHVLVNGERGAGGGGSGAGW